MTKRISYPEILLSCFLSLPLSPQCIRYFQDTSCKVRLQKYTPFADFSIFNLTWIEELIRYMFVWIVFLGIGIVYKSKGHAQVEILHHYLSEKWKSRVMLLVECINSALFLFLIIYGSRILKFSIQQISPSLGLNMTFIYGAVLVSSIVCFVHSSVNILELRTAKRDERVVVQVESQNTNMG